MTGDRLVKIEKNKIDFIDQFEKYGFCNEEEMVARALELLEEELKLESDLSKSAESYIQNYMEDKECKDWMDISDNDWE